LLGGHLISALSVIGWPCVAKQRQGRSGGGVPTWRPLFRRNPMECEKFGAESPCPDGLPRRRHIGI